MGHGRETEQGGEDENKAKNELRKEGMADESQEEGCGMGGGWGEAGAGHLVQGRGAIAYILA